MSNGFVKTVLYVAETAGTFLNDALALSLLAAPAVLFIGYVIVYCSNRNARGRGKGAFLAFGDICIFAFAALSACAFAFENTAKVFLCLGVALAAKGACLLLYGVLSLFPVKKEKPAKRKAEPVAEVIDCTPVPAYSSPAYSVPMQEPKKVRCFTEPVYGGEEPFETYSSDVRLDHIFSVLERLKGASLGAGDRLEAERYEELLNVYKAKSSLTAAEAQTLNDILASLLKMMAKYDI